MKKFYLIFAIILFHIGCVNKENNIYIGDLKYVTSFKDTLNLVGEKVEIYNFGATTIDLVDTFLVFAGSKLDTFYNVHSKYSYECLGNFIPSGRGENEFPIVGFPIFCKNDGDNALIYLQDRANGCVNILNLTQSVEQNKTIFEDNKIKIRNIAGFKYLYPISDSTYFLHGWNRQLKKDYYAIYNVNNEKSIILDTIYNVALKEPGNIFLFNTTGCFHPKKQKYATAMQFFNQINIYSLNDKAKTNIAVTTGKQAERLKEIEKTNMPDKFEFYEDMVCTDSLLFAIYANRSRKDWALLETLPITIHVFDWEGNPIYLLRVKEKLAKITIDQENGLLYGMTLDEKVYKYDLSMPIELYR